MKKVLLALLVVLAGLAGFVATRPAQFRIERGTAIHAPATVVYALVDDFHNWPRWSPWEKRDPAMTRAYSGAPRGEGAGYSWKGNKDAGEGAMTITSTKAPEAVVIKLDFIAPMKATNTVRFSFKEHAGNTLVQWTMEGEQNFVGKAFSLFFDMDKLVGGDFEQGLASMKTAAEAEATRLDAIQKEAAAAAPAAAPTNAAPATP